jgi:hypothetical protein
MYKLKEFLNKAGNLTEEFDEPVLLIIKKKSEEIRYIVWSIQYTSRSNCLQFLAGRSKDKIQTLYVDIDELSNYEIKEFKKFH